MLRSVVDPRVRYLGLSHNHGEQSAPNNAGVAAATGDFIAFLNHDDLWFPDHLEVLLDAATESAADLAHSLSARIDPEGRTHLWGDSPGGEYAPWHVVPASTWLFTRGLATRIGPWTSAADVYDAPSQDWLRRAHAGGGRFAVVVRLTAVQITSGGGQRSYADREEAPHAAMRQAMAEPARCRERLLTDIALGSSPMATSVHPVALAMRTLKAGAARVAIAAGVPPVVLFSMVRYGRRGDLSGAGGAPAGCHLRLEHAHDGSLVVARRVEGRAVHDRGLDVDHAPGHRRRARARGTARDRCVRLPDGDLSG